MHNEQIEITQEINNMPKQTIEQIYVLFIVKTKTALYIIISILPFVLSSCVTVGIEKAEYKIID